MERGQALERVTTGSAGPAVAPERLLYSPHPAMCAMNASSTNGGARTGSGRAQMRRRARYLHSLRELQLRDIGGFMVELERFGRDRPDLVRQKVSAAVETDRELRALEFALGDRPGVGQVRQPGIGGACPGCGTVHGSSDRFCSRCGHQF